MSGASMGTLLWAVVEILEWNGKKSKLRRCLIRVHLTLEGFVFHHALLSARVTC